MVEEEEASSELSYTRVLTQLYQLTQFEIGISQLSVRGCPQTACVSITCMHTTVVYTICIVAT